MPPVPLPTLAGDGQTLLSASGPVHQELSRNNIIAICYVLAAGTLPAGIAAGIVARAIYRRLTRRRSHYHDIEHEDTRMNLLPATRIKATLERARRMRGNDTANECLIPIYVESDLERGCSRVHEDAAQDEEGLGVHFVDVDLGDDGRWSLMVGGEAHEEHP